MSEESKRESVTQWIQIVTSILTLLAGASLWLYRTASTPSVETKEMQTQIQQLSADQVKALVQAQTDAYRLQELERRVGRLEGGK